MDLYSAIITKLSNALNTLVSGEKSGFQALSKGLVVLLCAEVVRQGVPDHGAVHSECSASMAFMVRLGLGSGTGRGQMSVRTSTDNNSRQWTVDVQRRMSDK